MRALLSGREIARAIEARQGELAARICALQTARRPERAAACEQEIGRRLGSLCDSLAVDEPDLFADFLSWARTAPAGSGAESDGTAVGILVDELDATLPPEMAQAVKTHVRLALQRLHCAPATGPALGEEESPLASRAAQYLALLLEGNRRAAIDLVIETADSGVNVRDIYMRLFQPAQRELGRLWQLGRASVAQEHFCTAATQLAMSMLYPRLFASRRNGLAVVGTCAGRELHELGLRMVVDLLETEGWDTYYLGANAPAAAVVRALVDRGAVLLAVSATLTVHLRELLELIEAVRWQAPTVKVLAGGYPFLVSADLWRRVGADGCARDAEEALLVARRLVGG